MCSATFTHVLWQVASRKVQLDVRVKCKDVHISNWKTVQRRYGRTRCTVTLASGKEKRMRLAQVTKRAMLRTAVDAVRIVRVRAQEVRVHDVRGEGAERHLLVQLATTQHGGKEALRAADFPMLERLWGRVKGLPTAQQRNSAQHRLCKQARLGWGVSLRARPLLRVCATLPRGLARLASATLFTALGCDTRPQVRRLSERMRTIREAPAQIGRELCDWRTWCREDYVPGAPPKCTCKGLIECANPSNVIEGHLAMRGRTYDGPGARALWCSEKTPIATSTQPDAVRGEIRTSIQSLVRSLPARVRDEVSVEMMDDAVRVTCKAHERRGPVQEKTPGKNDPTSADVRAIKTRFKDQVISLIDKERGELCVMCPVTQYKVMESAFPAGEGRYDVVDPDQEYDILCKAMDHAAQAGWENLGALYGTELRSKRKGEPKPPKRGGKRKQVRVPGRCEIARGYGTVKGKSWRAKPKPVIKGRPITPHTHHVLKRISNTSARAHHTWQCAINDVVLARLWETRAYKGRLESARAEMLLELQKLVPEAQLCDVGLLWIL